MGLREKALPEKAKGLPRAARHPGFAMLSLFKRKRVPPIAGTPPTSAIETPKGSMRPESAASLLATPRRQKLLEHIWQAYKKNKPPVRPRRGVTIRADRTESGGSSAFFPSITPIFRVRAGKPAVNRENSGLGPKRPVRWSGSSAGEWVRKAARCRHIARVVPLGLKRRRNRRRM